MDIRVRAIVAKFIISKAFKIRIKIKPKEIEKDIKIFLIKMFKVNPIAIRREIKKGNIR